MAYTTFVDGVISQANRIVAAWLNDVNKVTYNAVAYASSYGFATTATAAVNKAAIVAAITFLKTLNGGTVKLPQGTFSVAPGIDLDADNITIEGAGCSVTYGEVTCATQINFTTGTYGFGLVYIDGASAGSYCALRDLGIDGGGVVATGVKMSGLVTLENLQISSFTARGIHMIGLCNSSLIRRVSLVANVGGTGYGLFADGTGNTACELSWVIARQNTVGVRIENASHWIINQLVSESNTHEGLIIYKPTGGDVTDLTFNTLWLEQNYLSTSNYQLLIDSQTHDLSTGAPVSITFNKMNITGSGTIRHASIVCSRWVKMFEPTFSGGDQTNSVVYALNSYGSQIVDRNGGGIVDSGTLNYLQTTQLSDFSNGTTGGPVWPGTVYPGQVKYPATPVPATNANTVDGYHESASTLTLTGGTTAPTGSAKYTLHGNTVVLDLPSFTAVSNAVSKTLTGLAAECIPVTFDKSFIIGVQDNGGTVVAGRGILKATTGVIELYSNLGGSTFTAAGTFSSLAQSISYTLV